MHRNIVDRLGTHLGVKTVSWCQRLTDNDLEEIDLSPLENAAEILVKRICNPFAPALFSLALTEKSSQRLQSSYYCFYNVVDILEDTVLFNVLTINAHLVGGK